MSIASFEGFKCMKRGTLYFKDFAGYESRNESTKKLILLAAERYRIPDFDWRFIYTGDSDAPRIVHYPGVLGFATSRETYDHLCPDFIFDCWRETGMDDYEDTRSEIARFGDQPPESDLLGWRGNVNTHPYRQRIIQMSDNVTIDAAHIEWDRSSPRRLTSPNFVSFPDHARKWRYLIDIEGVGWSARLKLLLFSKRVVFLQERPFKEWYYPFLRPWEHYVPVARDLSDLSDRIAFLKRDQQLEERIRRSAFLFAQEHLTRDAALKRWKHVLTNAF